MHHWAMLQGQTCTNQCLNHWAPVDASLQWGALAFAKWSRLNSTPCGTPWWTAEMNYRAPLTAGMPLVVIHGLIYYMPTRKLNSPRSIFRILPVVISPVSLLNSYNQLNAIFVEQQTDMQCQSKYQSMHGHVHTHTTGITDLHLRLTKSIKRWQSALMQRKLTRTFWWGATSSECLT